MSYNFQPFLTTSVPSTPQKSKLITQHNKEMSCFVFFVISLFVFLKHAKFQTN